MKKGLGTLAAASVAFTLTAVAANANGRECDRLSPCTNGQNQGQGQHQNQGQHQGQGQNQNQNATGVGIGVGIGHGGQGGQGGQGGNANANATGGNANSVSNADVRNVIESNYINPATPGTLYGQVNGQCMATRQVSVGAYVASIASQTSEFNKQCMAWNTGLALLNHGINLHDPIMQAVAIETFREMNIDIDNAVVSVMAAAQGYQLRGQPMPMSAWGLVEMDGKHGQEPRSAPRTWNFD